MREGLISPQGLRPQKNLKRFNFILKKHQLFSVHTTSKKLENATKTGHFEFMIEAGLGREITWLS